MDRIAAQTLRVLGIVVTAVAMIAAALLLFIAAIFGLFSSTSSGDQQAKLIIGAGCPAVFIGGIVLIVKLTKGFARGRRDTRGEPLSAPITETGEAEPLNQEAEEESLLHLRMAVGGRILLGAALLTYNHLQPMYGARRSLVAAVLSVLVYEAPNGFVLWRIRRRLERFAVLLATAYAAVGLFWTLRTFLMYSRYMHSVQMLPLWLLPAAAEIAIIVTGWRARRALPPRADDASSLAAAAGTAVLFSAIAYGLNMIFYRIGPF